MIVISMIKMTVSNHALTEINEDPSRFLPILRSKFVKESKTFLIGDATFIVITYFIGS